MLKYYITVLFLQFTKTLIQFFCLSSGHKNFETCMQVWLEWLKELKQFWGHFTVQYLNKWTLSQKLFSNLLHSTEINFI